MRISTLLRVSLCFIALSILLSIPSRVLANATKEYVAKFTFKLEQPGQRNALSFELPGVLPKDVSVSLLQGSALQGGIILDELVTRTRVRIDGNVRVVKQGQTADIEIRLKNGITQARISDARWGVLINGVVPAPLTPLGRPRVPGGTWVLDPQFTAYNDIEDVSFGVRNLQLFTGITPDVFEALDLHTFLDAAFDPLLPSFFLSSGISTDDLALAFSIFPEPAPGMFLVATGQLVDEFGNAVGAFIEGVQVQAVHEPSTPWLVVTALLGLGALRSHRLRSRAEKKKAGV